MDSKILLADFTVHSKNRYRLLSVQVTRLLGDFFHTGTLVC